MRTVTFSNAKVAERINSNFVSAWYNRGKGFHNCEKQTEKWIFESSAECYPTKNICTFFLTPDLKVVYYVAGYYAPDVFLEILTSVQKLQAAKAQEELVGAHRDFSTDLSRRYDEVKACKTISGSDNPLAAYGACSYDKSEHRHKPQCLGVVAEVFSYRKLVHDSLADEGSVPFEKVQHSYKFGNPFSEEGRGDVETLSKPQAPVKPGTPTGTATATPKRK